MPKNERTFDLHYYNSAGVQLDGFRKLYVSASNAERMDFSEILGSRPDPVLQPDAFVVMRTGFRKEPHFMAAPVLGSSGEAAQIRYWVHRVIRYSKNPSLHACDWRCRRAKGRTCECSCRGLYHGCGDVSGDAEPRFACM